MSEHDEANQNRASISDTGKDIKKRWIDTKIK
jgi:hypothetical protein